VVGHRQSTAGTGRRHDHRDHPVLAALIFTGSDAGIEITGETGAAERFRRLIGTMAVVVQPV
jgi:hypothetical protein